METRDCKIDRKIGVSGESGGSGRQGIRVDGGDRGVWEKRGRQRGQGSGEIGEDRGHRGSLETGVMGDRGDRWSEETGGQGMFQL